MRRGQLPVRVLRPPRRETIDHVNPAQQRRPARLGETAWPPACAWPTTARADRPDRGTRLDHETGSRPRRAARHWRADRRGETTAIRSGPPIFRYPPPPELSQQGSRRAGRPEAARAAAMHRDIFTPEHDAFREMVRGVHRPRGGRRTTISGSGTGGWCPARVWLAAGAGGPARPSTWMRSTGGGGQSGLPLLPDSRRGVRPGRGHRSRVRRAQRHQTASTSSG